VTVSDPHRLFDEDKRLKTGKLVTIFWSRAGFNYRGRAKIVSLRSGTVTVTLLDRVNNGVGYAAGCTITVPRITDTANWSRRNCVQLLAHEKRHEMARLVE